MAEEKQSIKIPNINETAVAIFKSPAKDYDQLWDDLLKYVTPDKAEYTDPDNKKIDNIINRYSLYQNKDNATNCLLDMLGALKERNTPGIDGMDDFKRNLQFMLSARVRANKMPAVVAKSFVDQATTLIPDEELRYQMFKKLLSLGGATDARRELCAGIVQCKSSADISDWIYFIEMHDDIESRLRIFQQVERVFAETVSSEMSKTPYNMDKVQDMVKYMNSAIYIVSRTFNEDNKRDEWQRQVQDKYKLENIINGGPDYVSTLPMSPYKRIGELSDELQKVRKSDVANARIVDTLRADIARLQAELDEKQTKITELQRLNSELERAKRKSEEQLETLLSATKKVKTGLFGSGAKNIQDIATSIELQRSQESSNIK